MKIKLTTYKNSDGALVVKGWWGNLRVHYLADYSRWQLWTSDGEKIDPDRQSHRDQGENDDLNLTTALANINKYMQYHDY